MPGNTLVPDNILRNPLFCSFASFLIVSITPFIYKPYSPRDLTIFMISFTSSFEIINVVITVSVADATAVNPNGIKTLLANGLSTFPIKGNPVFSNGPKSHPRNPPDCPVLYN